MTATDLDPTADPNTPVWGVPPGERPDYVIPANLLPLFLADDQRDWGHANLRLKELHAAGHKGAGVKVAVLDTGVDYNHPDLKAAVKGGRNFTSGNPGGYFDGNSHGSHCAGIVGAAADGVGIVGAAPECDQYAGKVLSDSGSGLSTWIAAGIRWAADLGADVISLSLGGPDPDADSDAAIKYALAKGVWVVAAAGNDGRAANSYPGNYPDVVCVCATDESDRRAGFSTINAANDVSAPGVNIFSTLPGNRYGRMSGTSMATPYVAGALACVRGALKAAGKPVPDAKGLLAAIRRTAKDIDRAGFDPNTGWGLLDPVRLLADLAGPVTPPPPPPPPPGPVRPPEWVALTPGQPVPAGVFLGVKL